MRLVCCRLHLEMKPGLANFTDGISFDGSHFAQTDASDFNFQTQDYSVVAKIKTSNDGTIVAFTKDQPEWLPFGQTFFVRDGCLAFDLGWVGAANSKAHVADNRWHDVAVTRRAKDGRIQFYVDGKQSGQARLVPKEQLDGKSVVRIAFTNDDFPATSHFNGQMKNIGFYQRLLSKNELKKPTELAAEPVDRPVESRNRRRADRCDWKWTLCSNS